MGVGYAMMKGSAFPVLYFQLLEASFELSRRLVSAVNIPFASLLCQLLGLFQASTQSGTSRLPTLYADLLTLAFL